MACNIVYVRIFCLLVPMYTVTNRGIQAFAEDFIECILSLLNLTANISCHQLFSKLGRRLIWPFCKVYYLGFCFNNDLSSRTLLQQKVGYLWECGEVPCFSTSRLAAFLFDMFFFESCVKHRRCGSFDEKKKQPHGSSFVYPISITGQIEIFQNCNDWYRFKWIESVKIHLRSQSICNFDNTFWHGSVVLCQSIR